MKKKLTKEQLDWIEYQSLENRKKLYKAYCDYFHDGKRVVMSPFFWEAEEAVIADEA